MTLNGCFITGTDTEVGKTCVSAGLLHWFGQAGYRSAGLKPVAAGTTLIDGVMVNDDVRALRDASSIPLTDTDVGPCQFTQPCAPHIAAAHEGRAIDRLALKRAAQALAARADWLVVEGVGPGAVDGDAAALDEAAGFGFGLGEAGGGEGVD